MQTFTGLPDSPELTTGRVQAYAAGVKVRDKRAREAKASKKAWQSRVADLQAEEAALQRELEALAGAPMLQGHPSRHGQDAPQTIQAPRGLHASNLPADSTLLNAITPFCAAVRRCSAGLLAEGCDLQHIR